MTIGGRIKARRNELGLSQRELAARLGYQDHTTLVRVEGGKIDLPQSRIVRFAEVLGVTPGYLMGYEGRPEDAGAIAAKVLKDPALFELVKGYLTLDEEEKQMVCRIVDSLKKTDAPAPASGK